LLLSARYHSLLLLLLLVVVEKELSKLLLLLLSVNANDDESKDGFVDDDDGDPNVQMISSKMSGRAINDGILTPGAKSQIPSPTSLFANGLKVIGIAAAEFLVVTVVVVEGMTLNHDDADLMVLLSAGDGVMTRRSVSSLVLVAESDVVLRMELMLLDLLLLFFILSSSLSPRLMKRDNST
jgi:hypothetical protein